MMLIGMSVNVPKTPRERGTIQQLIVALETAASFAREAGLWFEGREAAPVFLSLINQLERFTKK